MTSATRSQSQVQTNMYMHALKPLDRRIQQANYLNMYLQCRCVVVNLPSCMMTFFFFSFPLSSVLAGSELGHVFPV